MNKKLLLLALPLATALLVGCSPKREVKLDLNYVTIDSVPVESNDKNAQTNLAESSTSLSRSMQELAAINEASHPDLLVPAPFNAKKIHMTERTSINWTGPVEPILRKVARAGHYQLNILGASPVIPVIVVLDKRNKPLANILQDIRYQVVRKAQIRVFPRKNIIELRYLKN